MKEIYMPYRQLGYDDIPNLISEYPNLVDEFGDDYCEDDEFLFDYLANKLFREECSNIEYVEDVINNFNDSLLIKNINSNKDYFILLNNRLGGSDSFLTFENENFNLYSINLHQDIVLALRVKDKNIISYLEDVCFNIDGSLDIDISSFFEYILNSFDLGKANFGVEKYSPSYTVYNKRDCIFRRLTYNGKNPNKEIIKRVLKALYLRLAYKVRKHDVFLERINSFSKGEKGIANISQI